MSFFNDIHIPGTVLQIGEVNKIITPRNKDDIKSYLEKNTDKDIYFCSNVDRIPKMQVYRASDKNILRKKYIYFDLDVRKDMQENGISMSDDDIKLLAREIRERLSKSRSFKSWSHIVFSGNGLHIYYIADKAIDVDLKYYSTGYSVLCKKLQKIIFYTPDSACKNPARLARIPGSYNNKADKKLVEILYEQDIKSNVLALINKYGKKEQERKDEIARFEKELMEIKKRERLYNIDEIIEMINRLPIEREVLKDFSSWNHNGKHFIDHNNNSVTSAYTHDNLLIISDSRWFKDLDYKGCGTYLYRREKSLMTNKQAIEYFKENYNLGI